MSSRWPFALIGLGFVVLALLTYFSYRQSLPSAAREAGSAVPTHIVLGGQEVAIEIADTPKAREQGLSGRSSLDENSGMFFIFDEPSAYSFWMPDMQFPIDIIWFDSSLRVVYIKEDAEPSSYPTTFTPSVPALYVLEVPKGFAAAHNIVVGSTAYFD